MEGREDFGVDHHNSRDHHDSYNDSQENVYRTGPPKPYGRKSPLFDENYVKQGAPPTTTAFHGLTGAEGRTSGRPTSRVEAARAQGVAALQPRPEYVYAVGSSLARSLFAVG